MLCHVGDGTRWTRPSDILRGEGSGDVLAVECSGRRAYVMEPSSMGPLVGSPLLFTGLSEYKSTQ